MVISRDISRKMRGIAILIVVASHVAEWMLLNGIQFKLLEYISSWGPLGVDIFFLMSGYALVKSAKESAKRTGHGFGITYRFILKRILAVYIPYIIVETVLYTVDGAWSDGVNIIGFLTGRDYWFMQVIFIMYILFMLIWSLIPGEKVKVGLLAILVLLLTGYFYVSGRRDFWELSNLAFPMGTYLAICEGEDDKRFLAGFTKKQILAGSMLVFLVTVVGMLVMPLYLFKPRFICEFVMSLMFTVVVAMLSYMWSGSDRGGRGLLSFLGANSLFIYLCHERIFWWIMSYADGLPFVVASICTIIATVLISAAVGTLYNRLL